MKNTKVIFSAMAAVGIGVETFADCAVAVKEAQIFKAARDSYVFAYFGNEREGMKLAASEDGLKWRELNDGKPVLVPEIGKEKLLRDPSVTQGLDGTFHAVWTTSWRSPEIGYASSKDLIHWSEQRVIPVMADFPSAKNAWAPEITFDDESGEFYIYWASTLEEDVGKFEFGNGDWLHRIYLTTTKDFKTFTPTRLWFEPPFTVIDAAIVKTGNQWMMVVKNEDSKPLKEKNLRVTFTDSLAKGFPVEVSVPINFCRESVEIIRGKIKKDAPSSTASSPIFPATQSDVWGRLLVGCRYCCYH